MGSSIILRYTTIIKSGVGEVGVTFRARYFHVDICQNDKQMTRELRFMNKLMTKGRPKRAVWYKAEQTGQSPLLTKSIFKYDHRRQVVLNKLFMRNITEIMATGEVAAEFVGHGIEISGVKVTPDFKMVNVYWVTKGSDNVTEVEDILKRSAKMLRHELTQLQLMGVMPRIQFVKDNQYAKVMEIDKRLSKADYGEEYIPLNSCYRRKPEFSNPESNCSIPNLEEVEEVEPLFPPMRMDVLGLNHADVMAKIKRSKKKAEYHHDNMGQSELEYPVAEHCKEHFHPIEFKKEEFSQFLMKRRIAKKKEKYVKNYFPEQELYESELLNDSTLYDESTENEEKDYMQE